MNILVTGGTGGVGHATVERLAQDAENHVWFTYRSSEDKAREMTDRHANTTAFRCDQTKAEDVERLCKAIAGWNLDALVNNAWTGTPEGVRFSKTDTASLAQSFAWNVMPIMAVTQAATTSFRKKKDGRIVTVLTTALVGVPPLGYGRYGAEKAYVAQMARTWAREYVKMGIVSNCVSPDFMQTAFTADTDSRIVEQMTEGHPLRQLLKPEQVAEVIAGLLHAPKHVNGVNIPINAGTGMI